MSKPPLRSLHRNPIEHFLFRVTLETASNPVSVWKSQFSSTSASSLLVLMAQKIKGSPMLGSYF